MTTDATSWGEAQRLNLQADGATSANIYKTKKSNKIPQETNIKRGTNDRNYDRNYDRKDNRTGQPSRRSNAGTGYARRGRHSWNAMMPALMARMGDDMMVRIVESQPSDEDIKRVERCFEELQATIAQLGTRWRLETFGSIASGFNTNTSDMDATCVQAPSENEDEEEQDPDPKEILLERLSPLLKNVEAIAVIEEIPSAKVPILRLRFEDHLDIDLSCQNHGALRNTRLLHAYAHLDPRIRNLGVAVKLWAKAAGVIGASQSKLSSYTFTLLMIYFLQVHRDVQLPCLSPGLFEETANRETRENALKAAADTWSCELPLADLFFRFISFYAADFEWGREVASPRLGQRRYSHDSVFQALRGRYVPRLHVEDPYLLQRNLHCVLGESEEQTLQEAFNTAWQMMFRGMTPVGLQSGKMELQLSELTAQSPQSSPDFGPAPAPESPDLWISPNNSNAKDCFEPEAKRAGTHPAEPPGILSSSGSTESGDGHGQLEPCSSAESNRSSDEEGNGASAPRGRFRSLKDLEKAMVHRPDAPVIATSPMASDSALSHSPLWGPQPAPAAAATGNDKWWLNLGGQGNSYTKQEETSYGARKSSGSAMTPMSNGGVITLEELEAKQRTPAVFSAEDLERKMTADAGANRKAQEIHPLFGKSFAASATGKIASRISNKCFWQATSQPHPYENQAPVIYSI